MVIYGIHVPVYTHVFIIKYLPTSMALVTCKILWKRAIRKIYYFDMCVCVCVCVYTRCGKYAYIHTQKLACKRQ